MKDCYEVKSERYGRTHRFKKTLGNNNYTLRLEESWMPIQITFEPDTKKLITVDPEGGPVFYEGWKNEDFIIKNIYQVGTVIFFTLEDVKKNPQ